jgi:hypothetical protein
MSIDGSTDWYLKQVYRIDGGFKDANVSTAIKLGDVSNTSFNTTNKTIVGAVNELVAAGSAAEQQIDVITVSSPGQTSFPAALSQVPKARTLGSGLQVSGVYVNGIAYKVYGTDYSLGGTGNKDLTWINAYSLQTTDTVVIEYFA